MDIDEAREYLDYFLPRDIIGPVFIVFALEHIIELLVQPVASSNALLVWTLIFLLSLVIVGYWGLTDDEYDELQEELQEDI